MKSESNYQRPQALQETIDALNVVEGSCLEQSYPVAIVVGRWHQRIADGLLEGALTAVRESGIDQQQIDLVYVPGAFEIPLATKRLAQLGKYRAIIALGAVIRGGTPHFEYVAGECVRGMSDVSLEFDVPVAFGVLTVDNLEQALERAAAGDENKGREAALAAIEMADLLPRLGRE